MPIAADDNEFPKVLVTELGADPAPPDSGLVKLYALTDGLLYAIDDAGNITPLASSLNPDADDIGYDNSGSSLAATDVQAAIDELAGLTAPTTHYQLVYDIPLTTGTKRPHRVRDAGNIVRWTLLADANVSASIDLWVDDLAAYPPTNADSITAAAPVAISGAAADDDATLTGWTVALAAGDVVVPNVDSITPGSATYLTLILDVERT